MVVLVHRAIAEHHRGGNLLLEYFKSAVLGHVHLEEASVRCDQLLVYVFRRTLGGTLGNGELVDRLSLESLQGLGNTVLAPAEPDEGLFHVLVFFLQEFPEVLDGGVVGSPFLSAFRFNVLVECHLLKEFNIDFILATHPAF